MRFPCPCGGGKGSIAASDFFYGRDDAGVAGAAAEVAAQDFADFGFRGVRIAGEEIGKRHQNARRAEAALPVSYTHLDVYKRQLPLQNRHPEVRANRSGPKRPAR